MTALFLRVAIAAAAIAVQPLASAAADTAVPRAIRFHSAGLYPETAKWSQKQGVFFVSSLRYGTIGRVSLDGQYSPSFIAEPSFVSTVGLYVDDAHDTLWITNADPGAGERSLPETQGKVAGVGAYDTSTGRKKAYYDLASLSPGRHVANDIAVDDQGNAYVTDSFSPIIYRIGVDGKASIFVRDVQFGTEAGYNLNGIVWNKKGFLIVGNTVTGKLFRVSTSDPSQIDEVKLPTPIRGADGFHLRRDNNRLVIAQQHLAAPGRINEDRILEVVSEDDWESAVIAQSAVPIASSPTSATEMGDNVYVLDSRIDTIGANGPKADEYTLEHPF